MLNILQICAQSFFLCTYFLGWMGTIYLTRRFTQRMAENKYLDFWQEAYSVHSTTEAIMVLSISLCPLVNLYYFTLLWAHKDEKVEKLYQIYFKSWPPAETVGVTWLLQQIFGVRKKF